MKGLLVAALLLAGCAPTPQADYRAGRYEAAAQGFRRAVARGDTSALAAYNLGTARLRLGEHPGARAGLESAAARARAPELRFAAEFNAGLADLEPALASGDSVPVEALRRAIARYRAALRLRPTDRDAKWNLELAERALTRPPEAPPRSGGGERDRQPSGGAGARSPEESSAGPGDPGLTREQADRILSAADQEERAVQRRRVQSAPSSARVARDW